MHATHTLHSLHTHSNADSVEFLPLALNDDESGAQQSTRTFVCGNYQLNEETRVKSGRIYLYQLEQQQQDECDAASAAAAAATVTAVAPTAAPAAAAAAVSCRSGAARWSLVEQSVLETAAIFDLKWAPRLLHGRRVLGQVDADGGLLLYQLTRGSGAAGRSSLDLLHRTQAVDGASALSLDWNNRKHDSVDPLIAISQSNSGISLWQVTAAGPSLTQRWTAHEYEMWIVSFDVHSPWLLYSGADDSKFKGWDLRTGAQSPRSSVFVDETHGAGVCTVAPHPSREWTVATGSYDESLRIWDMRSMRRPTLALDHALGGGVWRARWNPDPARADSILCAAMHNGFAVVDVDFGAGSATINGAPGGVAEAADSAAAAAAVGSSDAVHSLGDQLASTNVSSSVDSPLVVSAATMATYKNHASLAYGADWCAAVSAPSAAKDSDLIATCSFYDKQLDVWQLDARPGTAVDDGAAAAAVVASATDSAAEPAADATTAADASADASSAEQA